MILFFRFFFACFCNFFASSCNSVIYEMLKIGIKSTHLRMLAKNGIFREKSSIFVPVKKHGFCSDMIDTSVFQGKKATYFTLVELLRDLDLRGVVAGDGRGDCGEGRACRPGSCQYLLGNRYCRP